MCHRIQVIIKKTQCLLKLNKFDECYPVSEPHTYQSLRRYNIQLSVRAGDCRKQLTTNRYRSPISWVIETIDVRSLNCLCLILNVTPSSLEGGYASYFHARLFSFHKNRDPHTH